MLFILIACQVVVPDLATLGAIGLDPVALEKPAEEPQYVGECSADYVIYTSGHALSWVSYFESEIVYFGFSIVVAIVGL